MPTKLGETSRQREAAIESWDQALGDIEKAVANSGADSTEITGWCQILAMAKKEAQSANWVYVRLETSATARQKSNGEYSDYTKRYVKVTTVMLPKVDSDKKDLKVHAFSQTH